MRLLQKYVLGELIRVFVLVVSVLTILLVFLGAFTKASEDGLGPGEILQILPYLVPSLLPFTIPATMLLTVTIVYGRIAADHEVTAAKAAGISASSLLWPCLLMAATLSLVSLLLTDQVTPWALSKIEYYCVQMAEKLFLDVLRSQKFYSHPNQPLTIEVEDIRDKKLISPVIRFTPRGGETISVFADEAGINFNMEKRVVTVELINARGEIPIRQNFQWTRN